MDDFYEDIANDVKARFDMGNYSHSCSLLMGVNKTVIGLIKDELGRRIMTEFMALRPKLYVYKMLGESEDKKCINFKKCAMKKTLGFEDYKQCLLVGQNAFQKQPKHEVKVNKVPLNRNDDKRVILSNGMSMLVHGYKDTIF